MNVIPTATVLPCTPDDINDMLSFIFIGPGKYKPDCLKNMFHVHKSKIWNFLVWLKNVANNPLYQGITLDQRHVELYPDSDVLPGIDKCVVYDTTLNAKQTFDDETAAFSDHPALQVGQDDGEGPVLFLKKVWCFWSWKFTLAWLVFYGLCIATSCWKAIWQAWSHHSPILMSCQRIW